MNTPNDNLMERCTAASEEQKFASNGSRETLMTNELSKTSSDIVDVVIAGAGISGLVTALCLHRAGFSVRIYERAQILEPIGFGLNLQPYCVKLLHELGLEDEMDKIGVRTKSVYFYSRNGQFIYQEPRGIDAGYDWPMYSMHRGHFQEMLLRHVRNEIGETSIHLGQKLVTFTSKPDCVEVGFLDQVTNQLTTVLSKLLVGADGINSTLRNILYPNEGPPLWSGCILWRGVTSMDKVYLDGQTMIYMGNPNKRFMIFYPIGDNLVNWACVIPIDNQDIRTSRIMQDSEDTANIHDLLPLISDMKLDLFDIRQFVSSSLFVERFPVFDRDILPRWTHDRVTLIGDAAHPMYPYGGNGASQAIIDTRTLVLCFREHGITPQALNTYDDLRREAAHVFVMAARELGPLKILRLIDERSPAGFCQLSNVISSLEIEATLSKYRQLSGWNAQQLSREHPLF